MTRQGDGPPVVGIDLGGTKILSAVVASDHRILGRAKRSTPAKEGGPAILAAMIACVDEALEHAGLRREDIAGAGIGDIPVAVAGMENEKEFTRVMLGNEMVLDVDAAREEHVRVARRLVDEHPDVGAIVLECTNMPPYTADIQRATGLAVFDIVSLVTMVHTALAAGLPPRPA